MCAGGAPAPTTSSSVRDQECANIGSAERVGDPDAVFTTTLSAFQVLDQKAASRSAFRARCGSPGTALTISPF